MKWIQFRMISITVCWCAYWGGMNRDEMWYLSHLAVNHIFFRPQGMYILTHKSIWFGVNTGNAANHKHFIYERDATIRNYYYFSWIMKQYRLARVIYIYIFFFWLLFRLSEFQNYKHNNWVSIYEIRLCTIIIMCPTQFISPHNIYTHRIYMYIIIIEAKKNNSIVDCFSQQDLCSNDLFFIEKSHRIFSKLTHI